MHILRNLKYVTCLASGRYLHMGHELPSQSCLYALISSQSHHLPQTGQKHRFQDKAPKTKKGAFDFLYVLKGS